MNYWKRVFSGVFLNLLAVGVCAESTPQTNKGGQFFIYPSPEGWQPALVEDVQKVVISAASTLMRHFPQKKLNPIILKNEEDGPRTLYKRGEQNEYIVLVDISSRAWSQLSYQFAHELCHILSNYENENGKNQWFEEAICEAMSLVALEEMSKQWETNPPYNNWSSYASSLQKYLDNSLHEEHRNIVGKADLKAWYEENELDLREDPYIRNKNEVVGTIVYTLIRSGDFNIAAIQYLNLGVPDESKKFTQYINEWYQNAPEEHKSSVKIVADLFGVKG